MSLTQTGSTKLRRGKPLKSIWTTGASWFSNPPEKGARASCLFSKSKKPPPKNNPKKQSWQSGLEIYVRRK